MIPGLISNKSRLQTSFISALFFDLTTLINIPKFSTVLAVETIILTYLAFLSILYAAVFGP